MGTNFLVAVGVLPVELLVYQVQWSLLQIDRGSSIYNTLCY